MKRRPALAMAAAVAVVIAGLVAVLATREPALTKVADSPLIGHAAPDVAGTSIDGTSMRLSDLRGNFVVLNFFATWCIPCQQEHPELIRFAEQHRGGTEKVLQVIFDDSADAVREFVEKQPVSWSIIDDPDGQIALDFGVRGPPESFLIGPDGTVLFKIVGRVDAAGLNGLIDRVVR